MGLINAISLLLYLILFNACNQSVPNSSNMISHQIEYDLEKPTLSLKLPKELREISGISYFSDNLAIAIQDENAVLYFLSLSNGEIVDSLNFGEDGDYEGITSDEDNIYILRSDGYIFTMPKIATDSPKVNKINTILDNRFDTEGICYNSKTKNLLIACKENADELSTRNIFNYSIEGQIIEKNPAYRISLNNIKKYLENAPETVEFDKLRGYFDDSSEDFFYPSDIAIHPISGDIYICSAKSISLLIVISQEGNLKHIQLIPEEILPQTEGISFTPTGDLILCSEGKAKDERLFIFSRNEK
jgi:hypothetical protein